jgi:hypothetical protein
MEAGWHVGPIYLGRIDVDDASSKVTDTDTVTVTRTYTFLARTHGRHFTHAYASLSETIEYNITRKLSDYRWAMRLNRQANCERMKRGWMSKSQTPQL